MGDQAGGGLSPLGRGDRLGHSPINVNRLAAAVDHGGGFWESQLLPGPQLLNLGPVVPLDEQARAVGHIGIGHGAGGLAVLVLAAGSGGSAHDHVDVLSGLVVSQQGSGIEAQQVGTLAALVGAAAGLDGAEVGGRGVLAKRLQEGECRMLALARLHA